MPQNYTTQSPSILEVLESAPWNSLEEHLNFIRERIDQSITKTHDLRDQYREELLRENPELEQAIQRPSEDSMNRAIDLFKSGTIAASDGTISPVPLLGGSKIQVGVVIVSNRGDIVDLVTRVFEAELVSTVDNAREFFSNLRS